MGDINNNKPMEKQQITKIEDMNDETDDADGMRENVASSNGPSNPAPQGTDLAANVQDIDNIIQDEMVDINRFRY